MHTPASVGADEVPPYEVGCLDIEGASKASGHRHGVAVETRDPDGGSTRWSSVQVIAAIEDGERGEELRLLHAEALWTVGRYHDAVSAINEARRMYYYSVRARLLGYYLYRSAGDLEKAQEVLDEINLLGGSRRWGYRDVRVRQMATNRCEVCLVASDRERS